MRRRTRGAWYRQPTVWLGMLVFVASIAGCVWIIVVGLHHADTPVETSRSSILGVPTAHRHDPQPAHAGNRR